MKTVRTIAGIAALGLLTAGCGSSGGDKAAETVTVTAPPATASPTTTTAAPSTSAAEEGDSDVLGSQGNFSQPLTQPGTRLAFGQPAYLELVNGTKGKSHYSRAIVKVTVTQVRKGDPADLKTLRNADEMTGLTPYYLETENEIVAFEGNKYSMPDSPRFKAVGSGPVGEILTIGDFAQCRTTEYPYDGPVVGRRSKPCDVLAGGPGSTVTGAQYEGETTSDYYKSPVVWSGTATGGSAPTASGAPI